MTFHLNNHRTAEIKPEMLSGVQIGNGTSHDKCNIRGIVHVRTNRKDDICMKRRLVQNFTFILEWGQGICSLTKHTRRRAYSRIFSTACCLLRFAAFFYRWGGFPKFIIFLKVYFAKKVSFELQASFAIKINFVLNVQCPIK